ncbi:MAG: diacylglycerol kinase family protein, partial [Litorilinea sp.]
MSDVSSRKAVVSHQATLIYNPHAGFNDWRKVVAGVAALWEKSGWQVAVRPTEHAGHATELAADAARAQHGLVLVAGGDGTLNEVANGLLGTETVLAPLPVGTTNTFAKELGLPRPNFLHPDWLKDVSKALQRGTIQRMDMGQCDNGRAWLFWAGIGIDAYLVDQIEPRPRWFKRLGPAGYLAKSLAVLPNFSGVRAQVRVDDKDYAGEFVMVNISNSRLFGGGELRLNPDAVLDDGEFEVWMFRGRDWPQVLQYMLEISRAHHAQHPDVEFVRGRRVEVSVQSEATFHIDGEPGGHA